MTVTMRNVNATLLQTLENLAERNEGVAIYTEQNTELPTKNEILMNKMNERTPMQASRYRAFVPRYRSRV